MMSDIGEGGLPDIDGIYSPHRYCYSTHQMFLLLTLGMILMMVLGIMRILRKNWWCIVIIMMMHLYNIVDDYDHGTKKAFAAVAFFYKAQMRG